MKNDESLTGTEKALMRKELTTVYLQKEIPIKENEERQKEINGKENGKLREEFQKTYREGD